jgi:hypothetical protein
MADVWLKDSDTSPIVRAVLRDGADNPVDLSGAQGVRFLMRRQRGGLVVNEAATVDQVGDGTDGTKGYVHYAWGAGETVEAGGFLGEFEVTFADAQVETFPNDGYLKIAVLSDLEGVWTPYPSAPVSNMDVQNPPVGVNEQVVASGLGSGIYVPLDLSSAMKDPGGYVTTEALDYYGTIPAGRAFVLPPGVWAYGLVADWDTDATGVRMVTITNVDERIEAGGQALDTWLGDPTYGGWVNGAYQASASALLNKTTYRAHIVNGVIRTQASYYDSRWAVYVAQDSGAPRTLKGWTLQLLWLGMGV